MWFQNKVVILHRRMRQNKVTNNKTTKTKQTMAPTKQSEISYKRYAYLAKKYANTLYQYEELSYEYDDLLQEFRIKIFTSIKAYGRRYLAYMRGQDSKPVRLKYYLECACRNKANDLIKAIKRENNKVRIDEINYDFGTMDESAVNPEENQFVINGVDLLVGLEGKERMVFIFYLKGYNKNFLNKVYKNKASEVIENQKRYLISNYASDLRQSVQSFETYKLE